MHNATAALLYPDVVDMKDCGEVYLTRPDRREDLDMMMIAWMRERCLWSK